MRGLNNARELALTGATGFLGSAVIRQAGDAGWRIRAVTRGGASSSMSSMPSTPSAPLPAWIDRRAVNFADVRALRKAFEGASAVIHSAGLAHQTGPAAVRLDRFLEANVECTRRVVRAAAEAGVDRIAVVSSVAVYGRRSHPACETEGCHPESAYGWSKLQAERAAIESASGSGSSLAVLRMATLYGPGDPGNVLRLIRSVDRRRFIWAGRGENRKTLLHVEDAARACLAAVASRGEGVFNVTDEPRAMREIVCRIGEALNRFPRLAIPAWAVESALAVLRNASRLPGAARACRDLDRFLADDVFDGARFAAGCGFHPVVPFPRGIEQEVAWYRGLRPGKRAGWWKLQ